MRKLVCLFLLNLVSASNFYPVKFDNGYSVPRRPSPSFVDVDTSDKIPRVCRVELYNITLEPFIPFPGYCGQQDFTFKGNVKIDFQITNATETLPLRSKALNISDAKFFRGSQELEIASLESNPNIPDELVFTPRIPFVVNESYRLEFTYNGTIFFQNNGIYYDTYTDIDGKTRHAIATFLEPNGARKVFVGLDDPWFKANYSLSLIHPRNAQVFANAPQLKSNAYDNERNLTIFETNGPMSTYLFAFAMGSFHVAETKTKSNITIRAMAFANVTAPLDMWADAARQCVESMELLLNISYPFKKLDNLEMYTMMFAQAMENTQLIIYQNVMNRALNSSGVIELTRARSVICHEVAHQWFGDLTTTEVWGQEALHESFANYFENRALQEQMEDVDKQEIEMKCVSDRELGLVASEQFDHAVFDNRSHFDEITYLSGGAVLRMIQLAIGSEKFYKALNIYLRRHYLGNANEALENQTLCGSLTIREVMNDFLLQPHFPEIYVDIINHSYVIQQKSIAPNDSNKWNVPLFTFNLKTKEEMVVWLMKDGSICSKSPLNYPDVYLFNKNAGSFARVRYSRALRKKFWSMSTDIDAVTLYGMLSDLRRQPETDWEKIIDNTLNRFINTTTQNFSSSLLDLYTTNDKDYVWKVLISKIDWSATSLYGRTFNLAVSFDALSLGDPKIQSQAEKFYNDLTVSCRDLDNLENCNTIPFEARPIAYCVGYRNQTDNNFMKRYAERIQQLAKTYLYLRPERQILMQSTRCAFPLKSAQDY